MAEGQRGLGRKHSTPGSGAAAGAGGAVPCGGRERRGLGVIPKCMLCDVAALPQTGACGGEDRIQRLLRITSLRFCSGVRSRRRDSRRAWGAKGEKPGGWRDTCAALGDERAEELATSPLRGWDCREGCGGIQGARLAGRPGLFRGTRGRFKGSQILNDTMQGLSRFTFHDVSVDVRSIHEAQGIAGNKGACFEVAVAEALYIILLTLLMLFAHLYHIPKAAKLLNNSTQKLQENKKNKYLYHLKLLQKL